MRIINKENITNPIKNTEGELFYEMIGRGDNLGNSKNHSLGHVIVLDGFSTKKHFHPIAEETYYIIRGNGEMIVQNNSFTVKEGDVIFISPNEEHQLITNNGEIEAIIVCAPAWEINDTIFVD